MWDNVRSHLKIIVHVFCLFASELPETCYKKPFRSYSLNVYENTPPEQLLEVFSMMPRQISLEQISELFKVVMMVQKSGKLTSW